MSPSGSLHDSLYTLASLYGQRDAIAAPFTATIQALEYDRALATAAVDAAIAALEAQCKLLVAQLGQSVRAGTLTAVYQRRTYWDTKGLLAYALEHPSVLQFQELRPVVVFRQSRAARQVSHE